MKLKVRKSPKPMKAGRSLSSGRSPGKAVTEGAFSAHPHKLLQQVSQIFGEHLGRTNFSEKEAVSTGRSPFSAEVTGLLSAGLDSVSNSPLVLP